MDNDEIRLRIATRLGWGNFWYGDGIILASAPGSTIEDDRMPLPNWPADDAAALSLLTGPVTEAGLVWELYSYGPFSGCVISEQKIFGDYYMGKGPTVAAAICEAVLAWMDKTQAGANMDSPLEGGE